MNGYKHCVDCVYFGYVYFLRIHEEPDVVPNAIEADELTEELNDEPEALTEDPTPMPSQFDD